MNSNPRKIIVVGLGYVGLSNVCLLALQHRVLALDIDHQKIEAINRGTSPIQDKDISEFLEENHSKVDSEIYHPELLQSADYIVIATPTNYDVVTNKFDTESVERIIKDAITTNSQALIIIKSTIPIGFVEKMRDQLQSQNIIFCPEFLREGNALHDNFYPSRIVVGECSERAIEFGHILKSCAKKQNVEIVLTNPTEAEAIKLFANTYLAMRISFFNELDSFALSHQLNTKQIINGVCLDPRIGKGYNNPSFGYGGYCLPKDTKQLQNNYQDIPQDLISAIVQSNTTRIQYLVDQILQRNPKKIGIYRLIMKDGADNFRDSSIVKILDALLKTKMKQSIQIFEPLLSVTQYRGCQVVTNLTEFKNQSDLIVANRCCDNLKDSQHKVFTRDIFGGDL